MRTRLLALAALAIGRPAPAPLLHAQQLSAPERAILAAVDRQLDGHLALLERLVNINSGTLNTAGVRAVGDSLRLRLDRLGFRTRWVEMPAAMRRAGHLVAERRGTRGRRLLLIGHLDTVFEPDSPFQRWERLGDSARGPGASDMKGGDVIILAALEALHAAGALEGASIIAAFTGDEEAPGEPLDVARAALLEAAARSDVALEFEEQVVREGRAWATIARRSSSEWRLEVTGRQAHSSGLFGDAVGSGAIYEAARILAAFHAELAGEPYLTFNAGTIAGGTEVAFDTLELRAQVAGKNNIVPRRAVATGDIRTLSDEQLQRTRERMRAIVARHLPGTAATITFSDGYPAMPPTDGNRALLARLNEVNRALGEPPMDALDPALRGAADISFVAKQVDGLAGLGAQGSAGHTPQETVDLASFGLQVKRAAVLIYRLTR